MYILCYNTYIRMHTMLPYVVPPRVIIKGPDQANFGSNITVQCNILEGYPLPSVYIITPRSRADRPTYNNL